MEIDLGRLKELLAGRYRIDRELGRGGFATVFRVWNPRLARAEALKVLAPGHQADEDFSRRFAQEVHLAAALEHPSIVKVHEYGETEGVCWYSMQLVEGRTLAEELRTRGAHSETEAARIALPLLDALEYSHARGIVHRDIKPENVILDGEGRPYLMDFGIAKTAGSIVKTQTGFLMGTPAYVSPEQAQGRPLDGRTDVYALGVTLYKTVSGRYPFEASDPLQAVVLRLTQPPRPLAEALPGVDPAFAAIVMRALEREPSRRWESAHAMREAFAAYLAAVQPGSGDGAVFPRAVEAGERVDAAAPSAPPAPTVLSPRPGSPAVTSALGAPTRRSGLVPIAGGFVVLIVLLAATALLVLGPRRTGTPPVRRPAAARARPNPAAPATTPTAAETTAPTAPATTALAAPDAAPRPEGTPLRVLHATRRPEPEPATSPRPVTVPERLTPDPPFAGPAPAGCAGAGVTVGFAVDAQGNVVSPRLFPSEAPPVCGAYVLDALPGWRWRPAVDSSGAPVLSARLVVFVRLP